MIEIKSLFHADFPEKFDWSTGYELAVPLIDAQHKKLFIIFKNLVLSCKRNTENAGVQALDFMTDYMDFHFKAEEEFWHLDPIIYTTHRKAHYYFVKEVYSATGKIRKQGDISEDLLQFLGTWLLDHVLGMDRNHFAALRQAGLVDRHGFISK